MQRYQKIGGWLLVALLLFMTAAVVGGSFYMLDYSLSPEPNRRDTAYYYRVLFNDYPETRGWVDSLRCIHALRDTFVTMSTGERHHARFVWRGSNRTAVVLHGWRGNSIQMLFLARLYEQEMGYNVVVPDHHAHGLSEGEMIQMGWLDRKNVLLWLDIFKTDTIVVHGISMGGAMAMMMSAEQLPAGIRDIRFIDDCGYTCVWDEFSGELKKQFGLPRFPLLYTASLLCKLCNGWSFQEASAIEEVRKSPHPMLFIHGDADTFVPTEMVYRLYDAKRDNKVLWIAEGAVHAEAYKRHPKEYASQLKDFLDN